MSQQTRPQPAQVLVCDLCDEIIPEEAAARRASLVPHYGGHRPAEPIKAWHLRWVPGEWAGTRRLSREQLRAEEQRYRARIYDFHTECLLQVVETAMAARREEAPRD